MYFNVLIRTSAIMDTISDLVGPYVDTVLNFLNSQAVWMQAVIILALGIFTLIGLFVFLKKFIKVFIVLAIIGAIGYFLYQGHYLDGILGSFGALLTSTSFIM